MKPLSIVLCLLLFNVNILAQHEIGEVLPDFDLEDIDGNSLTVRDKINAPTILIFWSYWCNECEDILKKINKEKFNRIAIHFGNRRPKTDIILTNANIDYPAFFDRSNNVLEFMGEVDELPYAIIIDENSIIRFAGIPDEIPDDLLIKLSDLENTYPLSKQLGPEIYLRRAREAYNPSIAIENYLKVIEMDKSSPDPFHEIGDIIFSNSDDDYELILFALEFYEDGLMYHPDDPNLNYHTGYLYYYEIRVEDDIEKASTYFQKALDNNNGILSKDKILRIYHVLGKIHEANDDFEKSMLHYDNYLSVLDTLKAEELEDIGKSTIAHMFWHKGKLHFESGQYKKAIDVLLQGREFYSYDDELNRQIGLCHWRMKNNEEAIQMFEFMAQAHPKPEENSRQDYEYLATLYNEEGMADEATEIWCKLSNHFDDPAFKLLCEQGGAFAQNNLLIPLPEKALNLFDEGDQVTVKLNNQHSVNGVINSGNIVSKSYNDKWRMNAFNYLQVDEKCNFWIYRNETGAKLFNPYSVSHAIIIGIDKYEKLDVELPYSRLDGIKLQQILEEKGFLVRTLWNEQATYDNISEVIDEYSKNDFLRPNDRLLIYFLGVATTINGRGDVNLGYLLPYDVERLVNPSLKIPIRRLKSPDKFVNAKHLLIAIDACYQSDGTRYNHDNIGSNGTQPYDVGNIYQEQDESVQTIFNRSKQDGSHLFKAGRQEQQFYGTNQLKSNFFTNAFIKALTTKEADTNNDYVLTIKELDLYVSRNTSKEARGHGHLQEPFLEATNFGQGATGEFMFFVNED